MSATSKRRGPGGDISPYVLLGAAVALFVVVFGLWAAAGVGAALSGRTAPTVNPFGFVFALLAGSYHWPGAWATTTAVLELAGLAAVTVWLVRLRLAAADRQERIDAVAPHLAKGRELRKVTHEGAAATAARLHAHVPGTFLGRTVLNRRDIYASPEDTILHIWGPRTGKTTRQAICSLVDHRDAPALCTSNRRDVVDATRHPRSQHGTVWVFDLQNIIGEMPSWWWNPLSYVTDITTADKLAGHFASDSRDANAQTDAYFEPEGRDLLANFFLAAKLGELPITRVYEWVSDPRDDTPERLLREAGEEYRLAAGAVRGVLNAPEKQRGGVYGTARQMASTLRNPAVAQWITPPTGMDKRRHFSPEEFVRSTDTLYLISREGPGSAGALVTALTVAVCDAAEQHASHSPRGRLPRELKTVLDEAANVCKWSELPNLYSHYGSRGILLETILQSWAQGVDVWGERGMDKMYTAANMVTYGGGITDTRYLKQLSDLMGPFEPPTYGHSYQPNAGGVLTSNKTVSVNSRTEEIANVADLSALPPGRAMLFASGTRPTLLETVGWWDRDFAPLVRTSLEMHDPGGTA